jgi:hypothetical protein
VRSLSSSCRMRCVFSRIALMLRNINLGGAFSGIRSNSRPKSRPLERDASDHLSGLTRTTGASAAESSFGAFRLPPSSCRRASRGRALLSGQLKRRRVKRRRLDGRRAGRGSP